MRMRGYGMAVRRGDAAPDRTVARSRFCLRRCEAIPDSGLGFLVEVLFFFPLLPLSFSFQLLLFLDPRLSPPTEREREREKKRSRMFGKICRSVEHSLHLCKRSRGGRAPPQPSRCPPPGPTLPEARALGGGEGAARSRGPLPFPDPFRAPSRALGRGLRAPGKAGGRQTKAARAIGRLYPPGPRPPMGAGRRARPPSAGG